MNLMALIEEIDELEQVLEVTKNFNKRTLLHTQINAKKRELHKLNTIKDPL